MAASNKRRLSEASDNLEGGGSDSQETVNPRTKKSKTEPTLSTEGEEAETEQIAELQTQYLDGWNKKAKICPLGRKLQRYWDRAAYRGFSKWDECRIDKEGLFTLTPVPAFVGSIIFRFLVSVAVAVIIFPLFILFF